MKKLFTVRSAIVTSLILLPLIANAQTAGQVSSGISSFANLIDMVTNSVVKSLATLLLSLALLAFFYGLVEYIWAKRQGNGDKVKAGNEFMTWGLVALFVMFSVYGIIKFAQTTLFGGANLTEITIPNINFKAGTGTNVSPGGSPTSPGGLNLGGGGTTNNQGTAQDAYNLCMANGNTAVQCQAAYSAYGGTDVAGTQTTDCSSFKTSTTCAGGAGCVWESVGAGQGICLMDDQG